MKLLSSNVPFSKHLRHKTVFSGDCVYWKMHYHYAIEYMRDGRQSMVIIEAMIALYGSFFNRTCRLILVRVLTLAKPDEGNTNVMTVYGNARYKYRLSIYHVINTITIEMKHIIKLSMILVDLFWASKQYGLQFRTKETLDNN